MKFGLIFTLQDPPHGAHLSRLYGEVFAQAALAEEAGFELFLLPEHHQMPDGYMPAPLTFAAALAAHTKRAQIGTGILQLPLYHPLHIAEQIAVIDTIAKGRFILGAGLGLVEHEFNAFEIPLSAAATRFTESVEILRRAWSGRTFSHHGQHFNFDDVTITPQPVRQPPIWIGAMSTITLTRAGRIGDGWLSDPLHNFDVMRAWSEMYRAAARQAGNPRVEIALLRNAWVGDSRAELEQTWWPHVKDYHLFYLRLGFFASGRFNAKWEPWVKEITADAEWTCERVAPNRLIYGTPEQVVAELKRYEHATGCQYMILMLRCPSGPSHAETMRCIERFGTDVLPHFV